MRHLKVKDKEILLDDSDYDYFSKFKWYLQYSGKNVYAQTKILVGGVFRTTYLHRLITDCPTGMVVDHINGNGLDNRRENLRICTHRDNCRNTDSRTGTSKYKGVSWHESRNKWTAQIHADGVKYHLGYFMSEVVAAKAYNKAAEEFHEGYARLNVI